jgi:hypothetical protein
VQAQPLDQGLLLAPGQRASRILDHDVDLRHGLGRFLARRVHVPGNQLTPSCLHLRRSTSPDSVSPPIVT